MSNINRVRPLLLSKAVVSLYLADANGDANLSEPVFGGADAEGLNLSARVAPVVVTETGAATPQQIGIPGLHEIKIRRIWMVKGGTYRPFLLERGARYVLDICWEDDRIAGQRYQRTYYGVQCFGDDIASNGVLESMEEQSFTAETMVEG